MIENTSKMIRIFRLILLIGIIVWAAVTINTGFYVDENGLLVTYKGIFEGQRMFVDSWESLQTGGFLAWPLMALYYNVLSPFFSSFGILSRPALYHFTSLYQWHSSRSFWPFQIASTREKTRISVKRKKRTINYGRTWSSGQPPCPWHRNC